MRAACSFVWSKKAYAMEPQHNTVYSGIILVMGSANEKRCYIVMPPLIGWAHTKNDSCCYDAIMHVASQIAKFMGPTWGPPGSCRPQMGPMLAPWTLLSGMTIANAGYTSGDSTINTKRLFTKSVWQKPWLWLADAKTSAHHSQALC